MTLQRQTLSVPIGIGQSEAEAPPYVQGNAAITNVRFDKAGRASKRFPPDEGVSIAEVIPNAITGADGVLTSLGMGGSERYDEEESEMRRQTATEPRTSEAKITSILRGRRWSTMPSIAILQDVACVMWSDVERPYLSNKEGTPHAVDETAVYYAFYRIAGDDITLLSGPTRDADFVRSAKVVALETGSTTRCFIAIGEASDTEMQWTRYVLSAGDYTFVSGGSFPLGADRSAPDRGYDVCGTPPGYTQRAFCVWPSSIAGGASYVSSIDASNTRVSLSHTTAGEQEGIAIHMNAVSGVLYIAQLDGRFRGLNANLLGGTAGYNGTATLPAGMTARRAALCERGGGDGELLVLSDRRIAPGQPTGTTGTPLAWGLHVCSIATSINEAYIPNLVLFGKPLRVTPYNETPATLIPVQGSASRRGFLISIDEIEASTPDPDEFRAALHASFSEALWCESNTLDTNVETNWTVPLVIDADDNVHTVYPIATQLDPISPTFVTGLALDHVRIRPAQHAPVRTVRASEVVIYAGGAGAGCVDGFMAADACVQRPDAPLLTGDLSDATHTPLASAATFYVAVGWAWIDQSGREHRSAISEPTAVVWDACTTGTTPYLWAAPLPTFTSLQYDARRLILDVYFSVQDDASIMRRTGRLYNPDSLATLPDCRVFYLSVGGPGSSPSVTYPNAEAGMASDVSATAWPLPYTDTELEAEAPAALLDIVSTQQRLWALSAESRFSVLVTKPIAPGYAPEFSSALSIDVPAEGGPCVGLGALDDKIVVFKRDRLYVIVGDPGDATGERSTVQKPRLVSGDVGCICAASIVEGPFGLAFMSRRGIMLLSRGLELSAVGERVEDATAGLVGVGILVPSEKEVRWLLATDEPGTRWALTGGAVTWNYDRNAWAQWDTLSAVHMAPIGRDVWTAYPQAFSREQSSSWITAEYAVSVTTPWVALNGVEGFQRVWRIVLLLEYYTGTVTIGVTYDYTADDVETHVFSDANLTGLAASDGRLELSIRPSRQKCSAIRVTVTEGVPISPPGGRGFSFLSMDLEVGVKSGTSRRRLPTTQKG